MDHIGTFGASPYRIRDLHLFRDTDEAQLAAALAHCAVCRLAHGQRLEDTFRARLYIVLRGALAETAPDGAIGKILPGESVGEQSVLDETTNLADISAIDDTELLVIEADLVWQLIDQSNGVARNLLRLLSFRIRAASALLRRRQKLGEFYRQLSMNDGLTGLYNRAWLADMLPKMVSAAQRAGHPLSLVMIDLDHFKRFNDTHGHLAGDEALRAAAGVINAALRPSDFAVRYGGEEMLVILPETGEARARMVAERLCERLRQVVIFDDMRLPMPQLTGSFGAASLGDDMDEQTLLAAADAALYRAKESGRDRVSL
ncbi:GGDEF domain-containing protein [Massilia sp. R2A-15]|uniref:GGDEF domain-containing protein n=1 Tax=Massilia sp. R2A-15 TaxID=3064278 RepID=UPI0027352C1B|nr:GGDEF domain-containing protein [Massilia sp. R2A-15]WLI90057.1 GGDEF domain-containing protein [Massilia sp. R2A-15]